MAKFTGINHLAMVTGDMDATIRYWRDLLGLRLVLGLGRQGYRHYFFEISPTDSIAFFEWPGAEPISEKDHGAPVRGPIAFDHVSLGVDTKDQLWELKDKISEAGFWVSEVVDHGFIHSIYTFDPNNIPLEFSVDIAGRQIRQTPMMKDSDPSISAAEGSEPISDRWPPVKNSTPGDQRRVYPGQGSDLLDDLDG